MRKKVIILILILVLAIAGYNYLYQDHRDIEKEHPEFTVSSNSIHEEFAQNFNVSEQKYNDKTILISGIISELNQNDVTLSDKIFCQFNTAIEQYLKLNSKVKIKGRIIGYDDLLELIKLDQCMILN
jgi:hypothetical protein